MLSTIVQEHMCKYMTRTCVMYTKVLDHQSLTNRLQPAYVASGIFFSPFSLSSLLSSSFLSLTMLALL